MPGNAPHNTSIDWHRALARPLRGVVRWLSGLILAIAATTAVAREHDPALSERWVLDAQTSSAKFRVRVFGLWPVSGVFIRFGGAIAIDRRRQLGEVEAVIEAASVSMTNPAHADWVRSPEFFDATAYPQIRFVSNPFALTLLANGGELPGSVTLRGVSHAVTFAIAPSGCDIEHRRRCAVDVSGNIRRSDFGMRSRRGALSDRVTLRFHIEAIAAR